MKKICPKCRKEYGELENYCTKCGIGLERMEQSRDEMHRKIKEAYRS